MGQELIPADEVMEEVAVGTALPWATTKVFSSLVRRFRFSFGKRIWKEVAESPPISEEEYARVRPGDPIALGTYGFQGALEKGFREQAKCLGARTLGTYEAVWKDIRNLGDEAIVWWEKGYLMDAEFIVFYLTGMEKNFPTSITYMELLAVQKDPLLRSKTIFLLHPFYR